MLNRELFDATIELGIDLERVSASARAEIIRLLKKMEKELVANTEWQQARVNKQIAEAKAIIRRYYNDAAEVALETTSGAAKVAASATATSLTVATGSMVDVVLPSASFLESIAGDAIIQGATQSAWWARQSDDTAFKFAAAVRQGLVAAETNQQIIKRVMDVMDISRRNAAALVQTSVQTVANNARIKTLKENGDIVSSVEWVAALDAKTCIECAVMDGKRWGIDGTPIGHSVPFRQPPIHFNDRCSMVPITKTFRELGIDIDEVPEGTRASMEGQVSDKTFADFLSRKGTAYQDEVLGKGRADLYRRGVISFNDLVDGKGSMLTLAQLRQKYIDK